jgi:DNA-binding NarL/FixJ family response regulator
MNQVRILLADDHEVVRHGMRAILQTRCDWEVCGEAKDGMEAVEMAEQLNPDVIVMDICMPNLNGLEATRQILRKHAGQKILIVTVTHTEQVLRTALEAGARGFVLKSDAARDLVSGVEALQQNSTFLTPRVSDLIREAFLGPDGSAQLSSQVEGNHRELTPRERQIVQLLAEGKSTKEVATILAISFKTAETHRNNIFRKLNIHSVVELAWYALRNNIVMVPKFEASPAACKAPSRLSRKAPAGEPSVAVH